MRKTGIKNRWDYKHPDSSYKDPIEMPSGNMMAGVNLLIKNLIVRAGDLFGKDGKDQKKRLLNLDGHVDQINIRLNNLYKIDEYNYGNFESDLAQRLIKAAQATDLERFPPIVVNFNFKMTSLKFYRNQGEKVSIEWWGYLGNQQ